MESVVGRGTLLAGRYRTLQPLPSDLPGASVWDATDQILDRPVRVTVLHTGRVAYALDAARRAALVTDPRLVRVLDVGEHAGVAYTVTEQVNGPSLVDLVARGPLSADQARAVVGEAAAALESARRRGVHHLALRPSALHLTPDDRVLLTGLAVDGALVGLGSADAAAARADTVGLVALLYTGLTGRWPASGGLGHTLDAHLPLAPVIEGAPVPPAEVASGVPNDLDTLCAVTLGVHDDGPQTPAQLVAELEPWGDIRTTDLFAATAVQPVLPTAPRRPPTPAAGDPAGTPGRVQRTSVRSVFAGHAATAVTRPGTPPPAVPTRPAAFLGPVPGARADLPVPSDAPTTALPTTGPRPAGAAEVAAPAPAHPQAGMVPPGASAPTAGDRQAPVDPAADRDHDAAAAPTIATPAAAAPTAAAPTAPATRTLRPPRPARPARQTPDQEPAPPSAGAASAPAAPAGSAPAGSAPAGSAPAGSAPASSAPAPARGAPAPGRAAPRPPAARPAPSAARPAPSAAAGASAAAALRSPDHPAADTRAPATPASGDADDRPPLLPLGRAAGLDVAAARESIAAHRFDPTRLVLLLVGLLIVLGLFAAYRSLTRPVDLGAVPQTVATEAPAEQPAPQEPAPEPAVESAAPAQGPVIASAAQLDPPPDGDQNEHPEAVPLAIDGDPATVWFTRTYNAADFGGLKQGVGYAVTLAEPATVTTVTLQVRGSGGQVEVRATDPSTPTDGDVLASGPLAPETVLTLSTPTETASIVLWFTELPQAADGGNRLELAEVTLS